MKKTLFSKVAASVIAGAMVLGMTVTAFAADPLASGSLEESGNAGVDSFVINTADLTDEQRASIASVDLEFTLTSDYLNGCVGYNKGGVAGDWVSSEWNVSSSGVVTVPIEEDYALSEDGSDSLQVQFWWLNAGSFSLDAIDIKDGSGESIKRIANEDAEVSYYVAGAEGLCGKNWDPAGSPMTKNDDGTYSVTFTGIAAGTYEFKVTNGTWDDSWNLEGSANDGAPNASVEVAENDSTVVVTFDGERASVEVKTGEEPAPEKPGDGFVLTGTSVTMKDGGIRINVYNPWGGDDTHAVESMAPIDGNNKVDVTVKVTGLEASGLGSFKMWLNGGSNVDGNNVSYWESDGSAKDGCQSTVVEVSEDGEYTVTLTSEEAWAAGDNNFLAVMTDIDADAWNALNEGEGDTGLLSITGVNASKDATNVPSGEGSHTALIVLLAVAGLAGVAAAASKKFLAEEK